jgi:hypothetical protein
MPEVVTDRVVNPPDEFVVIDAWERAQEGLALPPAAPETLHAILIVPEKPFTDTTPTPAVCVPRGALMVDKTPGFRTKYGVGLPCIKH